MNIGFTGTQLGMNEKQLETLRSVFGWFHDLETPQFHHGDCIGADEQAHQLALEFGFLVYVHPPINGSKRAFCTGYTRRYREREYIERNHAIVDACDTLIVAPKSNEEELRSGTWATYRYAKKLNKVIVMLERE